MDVRLCLLTGAFEMGDPFLCPMSEPSSFCYTTPPWGRIVPHFEVSVKPGLAHPAPFFSPPVE